MTTQLNVISWSKTLPLDYRTPRLLQDLGDTSRAEFFPSCQGDAEEPLCSSSPSSPLCAAKRKRNVEELRRDFLQRFIASSKDEEPPEVVEQRRTPSRKISFKCKKPTNYRRAPVASNKPLTASAVAELTLKFNEMVAEKGSILEQHKFTRLVRKVNSQRSAHDHGAQKVMRKPSVKMKPTIEKIANELKKRPKSCANELECDGQEAAESEDCLRGVPCGDLQAPLNVGSVRATIEIFERRTSHSGSEGELRSLKESEKVPKPKVPEKKPNIKTKDLIIKDGVRKLKIFEKRNFSDIETNPTQLIDDTTVPAQTTTNKEQNDELQQNEQETGQKTDSDTDINEVQILNIPLVMPRRCDSMYETSNLRKISPSYSLKLSKSEGEVFSSSSSLAQVQEVKPNTSFLWRRKSQEPVSIPHQLSEWENIYDKVDAKPAPAARTPAPPAVPPRPASLSLKPVASKVIPEDKEEPEEKIYEELENSQAGHGYELCRSPFEQKDDDDYEYFESPSSAKQMVEDTYETLSECHENISPTLTKKQKEPLPPRPGSRSSYDTIQNGEGISNCYESIYNESQDNTASSDFVSNNYESIYVGPTRNENWDVASNRDSLMSSDQQSNSLYGRSFSGWSNDDTNVYATKAPSELSGSDKSDDWVDISDCEENVKSVPGFIIVRERQKSRKTSGWSQQIRNQWNKSHSIDADDSDSDHHYESLYNNQDEDFDSFESDTESETSFCKVNQHDSGVDMGNLQLPDPPASQTHGLTRLAVSAGKHMKRLRRNWSLTKSDITKSLSRMAKRKPRANSDTDGGRASQPEPPASTQIPCPASSPVATHHSAAMSSITQELKMRQSDSQVSYQSVQVSSEKTRSNSLSKRTFLNKFRRSMTSLNVVETTSEVMQPKSTFYLTNAIDVDSSMNEQKPRRSDNNGVAPTMRFSSQRPQSPPPPIPTDVNQNNDSSKPDKLSKRSTSWYAECGLFPKNEGLLIQNNKHPNTSWYAEIGLYQSSASTPSTSSAENSGSTTNTSTKTPEFPDSLSDIRDSEDYYNVRNESGYYNESITSSCCDTLLDKSSIISADIQLRLQDEPLYQFYDAAVLETVCQDGTTDFDYDGYEEVGDKSGSEYSIDKLSTRPSAMQLISPGKNGITVVRTLWCEIPEVLQSAVLSTLSMNQKKLQEAKFEMMTSEASYLNSLNVLTDHFISNLTNSDMLTYEEKSILFGKIPAVKYCSEKLLADLEKCWQDNILLHGICDTIQKHAEENFYVYVSYCENQILLDSTLQKIRNRSACNELLKQLECCSACQSLSLYSFLMLPMQRITRWPLLVDAVLKRLSPQDDEYLPCQYTLATINKIVTQCNEAARKMERETEIKRIAAQIEFPKEMASIRLLSGSRWLVRSGPLTQMQTRGDDIKLTFGKRFIKIALHLFLFNDLLLITKPKSEDNFVVVHYCFRSYVELNVSDVIGSLSAKDMQGRHLLFLTILENHEGKTVEMLLSCSSESDRERWIEALSPPKSEDPNETLYECWDCPQVTAIHNYSTSQPDELALSRGDIVNVTRKMADGWYHGERIRDGQTGWFPSNYTMEVANPHVRARNLKQRYRLLAFSESYLKSK